MAPRSATRATRPRPVWLGEWRFEGVRLDGEAIPPPPLGTFELAGSPGLPTLVPAKARLMTREEAEAPPE